MRYSLVSRSSSWFQGSCIQRCLTAERAALVLLTLAQLACSHGGGESWWQRGAHREGGLGLGASPLLPPSGKGWVGSQGSMLGW